MNHEENFLNNDDKKNDNPIFEDSEEIEYLTMEEDKEAKDKLMGILSDKEKKIKKEGVSKKVVILIVLIGFLLSLCYTAFALGLSFDGKTSSSVDGIWDIGFTDMYQKSKSGKAFETTKPSFTHHEATFNVALTEPGDEITYDLTITNKGNLDAKLVKILVLPENTSDDVILYFVSGIKEGDVVEAGKSTNMTVTAKYSMTHSSQFSKKAVQIVLNYVQK